MHPVSRLVCSMRSLLLTLLLIPSVTSSVLDSFRAHGIEYEVHGEGYLLPEKEHCFPYTLDLNEFVNTFNTNSMNDYSRGLLQKRIFSSFDSICRSFNVPTDSSARYNLTEDRSQMRYLDYFEYNWHSLRFERDLKSLFLENKINLPFLDSVKSETILRVGASDGNEFASKTTVFPKACNVKQMTVDMNVCYNMTNLPVSGTIYALAHGGEFLNNEEVFVYYDIPQFVLISQQAVIPIELEKCKVVFGTFIYCFERLATKCDVSDLSECPIYAYKTGDEFVFRRNFGIGYVYATTETEIDLYKNGTKSVVPHRTFILRTSFGTSTTADQKEQLVMIPEMTPHLESEVSGFGKIAPDALEVLSTEKPTRLFMTGKDKTLSNKRIGEGAWNSFRGWLGF